MENLGTHEYLPLENTIIQQTLTQEYAMNDQSEKNFYQNTDINIRQPSIIQNQINLQSQQEINMQENFEIQLLHQDSVQIKILEKMFSGGQANVYLCYDKNEKNILVYKQFRQKKDYRRELDIQRKIQDQNISICPDIYQWIDHSNVIILGRGACSLQQYSNQLMHEESEEKQLQNKQILTIATEVLKQQNSETFTSCNQDQNNQILLYTQNQKAYLESEDYQNMNSYNKNSFNPQQIEQQQKSYFQQTKIMFSEAYWKEYDLINIVYEIIRLCKKLHDECGIFHCDLKPANIIFYKADIQSYAVKLIDFGAACRQTREYGSIYSPVFVDPFIRKMIKSKQANQISSKQCIQAELYSIGMTIIHLFNYSHLIDFLLNQKKVKGQEINYEEIKQICSNFLEEQSIQSNFPQLVMILKKLLRLDCDCFEDFEDALKFIKKKIERKGKWKFIDSRNLIEKVQNNMISQKQNNMHPQNQNIIEKYEFYISIRKFKFAQRLQENIIEAYEDSLLLNEQQRKKFLFNKCQVLIECHESKKCYEFLKYQTTITQSDPQFFQIVYLIGKSAIKLQDLLNEALQFIQYISNEEQKLQKQIQSDKLSLVQLECDIAMGKLYNLLGQNKKANEIFENINRNKKKYPNYGKYYEYRNYVHQGITQQFIRNNTLSVKFLRLGYAVVEEQEELMKKNLLQDEQILRNGSEGEDLIFNSDQKFNENLLKYKAILQKLISNSLQFDCTQPDHLKKALVTIEDSINLYNQFYSKHNERIIKCQIIQARIYKKLRNHTKALEIIESAILNSQILKIDYYINSAQYMQAEIYMGFLKYDKAKEILLECKKSFITDQNHTYLQSINTMLGLKALEYFQEVLEKNLESKQINHKDTMKSIINVHDTIDLMNLSKNQKQKKLNWLYQNVLEQDRDSLKDILTKINKSDFHKNSFKPHLLENFISYLLLVKEYDQAQRYLKIYEQNMNYNYKGYQDFIDQVNYKIKNKIIKEKDIIDKYDDALYYIYKKRNYEKGYQCLKKSIEKKEKITGINLNQLKKSFDKGEIDMNCLININRKSQKQQQEISFHTILKEISNLQQKQKKFSEYQQKEIRLFNSYLDMIQSLKK